MSKNREKSIRHLVEVGNSLTTRRLLVALLVSLLFHTLLISVSIDTKKTYSTPHRSTLQVELKAPEPLREDTPQETKDPAEINAHTETIISKNSSTLPQTTAPSPAIFSIDVPSNSPITQSDIQGLAAPPRRSLTPDQFSRLINEGPISQLEMEFEIFKGEEQVKLGKALHHYETDADGNYYLRVVSDDIRLLNEDSAPVWEIRIEGNISERGLRPMGYSLNGEQARALMALSGEEEITETTVSGRMPDSIMDRVSMIYQFMNVVIPEQEGIMQLTDGQNIGTYTYRIVGTEPINVSTLGTVESQHITFSNNENAETIDLWLATGFRNAPVKVIYRSASGEPTEQILSSILLR